jgi:hypothetical protein
MLTRRRFSVSVSRVLVSFVQSPTFLLESPRCEYSAEDGMPNTFHLVHLGQYAARGCGTIIFEASGVLPNGRITPNCPGELRSYKSSLIGV